MRRRDDEDKIGCNVVRRGRRKRGREEGEREIKRVTIVSGVGGGGMEEEARASVKGKLLLARLYFIAAAAVDGGKR